ncbi:MAG: type I secretion system permease/ATPase [Desulfovibrionaceae bacterium]
MTSPTSQNSILDSSDIKSNDVDYTPPLIACLSLLFGIHGKAISTRYLMAGMPASGHELTPSACMRSARNAGMKSKLVHKKKITHISALTLPCILLLKNQQACVLLKYNSQEADVLMPETGTSVQKVLLSELSEEYTGYVLFAKPDAPMDKRASDIKLLNTKRWFWDVLLNYLPIYKHVIIASLVLNLLAIASPLFFMNVYDRVVPNKAFETLWVLGVGILIAYFFDFLLKNLRSYFVDVAGRNADVILASKLLTQVMGMRFDDKPDSTGSIANNLKEFESLREFFSSTTLLTLMDLPFVLILLGIVYMIGGPIILVPLIAIPFIVFVGFLIHFPFQRIMESGYKEGMQKNALLVEILNGLETVKVSLAESRMQDIWEKIVGQNARSNSTIKGLANFSISLSVLTTQVVSIIVVIWSVYRISEGLMSMGALIACNMLISRAMAPFSQVASLISRLHHSRMALKSLNLLMELPVERPAGKSYIDFGPLEPSISFDELSFAYPKSERRSLDAVSFSIRAGEKVGILGRMGSGKSTLGRLAVGLYLPQEGAVKFGGIDIRQLDMSDLRPRVGFVSQDNYLFYGTVRDNIAIGVHNADDQMILRAATIAGVTDFVKQSPSGFGLMVGERGMNLSGGQRQAVAIARALLLDPDVLILDEPSSNMDHSSEDLLKSRLSKILGNKTLLLITHRPSMLDLVDRIIILDNGKVVADGPKNLVLESLRQDRIKAANPAKRA